VKQNVTEANFGAIHESPDTLVIDLLQNQENLTPLFLDSERVSLYVTLSGLIEAGIELDTALMLVQTEAKAQNKKGNAERISQFFTVVQQARDAVIQGGSDNLTDLIGEAAARCFGRNFVIQDELVLLRGLAYTDNMPPILRSAAEIIRNKTSAHAPTRPSATLRRFVK